MSCQNTPHTGAQRTDMARWERSAETDQLATAYPCAAINATYKAGGLITII